METLKRYFFGKFRKSEHAKILFQYLLLTILSSFIGAFLAKTLSYPLLREQAIRHFSAPFSHCLSWREVLVEFLRYVSADLISAILLLSSSFSLLNYFFSNVILAFQGIRLGVIAATMKLAEDATTHSERIGLLFLRLGTAVCFVGCAYLLSCCSYEFRKTLNPVRFSFPQKTTMILFGTFLGTIILIMTMNILYCGFIFLI